MAGSRKNKKFNFRKHTKPVKSVPKLPEVKLPKHKLEPEPEPEPELEIKNELPIQSVARDCGVELNDVQKKALAHVHHRGKSRSESAYLSLLSKIKHTKYSDEHLDLALRYIRDHAPMIIHIHLDPILLRLNNDSHYRNQFETKTSNGSLESNHAGRKSWETRMFGGAYDGRSVTGFDRVKYGVFNIFNCPAGVSTCFGYGDSYMVLKRDVRFRTTCADRDSSCGETKISNCEHYCHLLNEGDVEGVIEAALDFYDLPSPVESKNPLRSHTDNCCGPYKEIQIHGPIRLNRDISKLIVNVKHKDDRRIMAEVAKFCAKNRVTYGFTDGTGPSFLEKDLDAAVPEDNDSLDQQLKFNFYPPPSSNKKTILFLLLFLLLIFVFVFFYDTSPVLFLL